ncbi:hypothetical protein [Clostridium sp. FS41]|uniref:hypothetical protein n=1 Tax=Clostridium sp. FS41 TaxID=1609975 RepID=UPI00061EDC1F|nr:hypothetical protein [Clostridium sp. FS41]KJJ69787.1 hypothetical protein CLFS41_38420 [Clostridium sp. FS41]
MERRSGARAIVRNMHSVQRRFLAFVLAAAMIFTNVGANMNQHMQPAHRNQLHFQ